MRTLYIYKDLFISLFESCEQALLLLNVSMEVTQKQVCNEMMNWPMVFESFALHLENRAQLMKIMSIHRQNNIHYFAPLVLVRICPNKVYLDPLFWQN